MPFYEFHLCTFLKSDTPLEVYHTLQYMVSKEKLNEPEYVRYSKEKIFQWTGWDTFLTKELPHFPVINSSHIRQAQLNIILTIHCSFLSMNDRIILDLLEWLRPYIPKDDFIGFYREYEKNIQLILFENKRINIKQL